MGELIRKMENSGRNIIIYHHNHHLGFALFCKKYHLRILASLFLVILNFPKLLAQSPPSEKYTPPVTVQELWALKERLTYSVTFGFLQIGTVSLQLMPDTIYQGKSCHYIKAVIRSNPGIPLVGKKEKEYNSILMKNDTIPFTLLYWTNNSCKKLANEEVYRLDYDAGKVYAYKNLNPCDTLSLTEPSICGPVSLFYTRLYAGTNRNISIPIYIDEKRCKIEMDNMAEIQDIKCGCFKEDRLRTYVSRGDANFSGPFGFNGKFTVWFTTDSLRIPVMAYLKVWLGNVKIRIIKYEKLN